MTNHIVRLYTAAGAIVIFFLLWATIAARPWATTEQVTPQDPRLVALAQREKNLRKRAAGVNRVVARRWAIYERRSARRQRQNAAALQRHMQELEASQAAAVRTTQKAVAETARARAYAASVVAWANQQLQAASSSDHDGADRCVDLWHDGNGERQSQKHSHHRPAVGRSLDDGTVAQGA